IHLLPFFPSTSDRGFSPTQYDKVDPLFGDWKDIQELSDSGYYLMFDFMINHLSSKSLMYQDFKKNHNNSQYKDFFLRWEKFWQQVGPNRPTKQDVYS
ncbi:MAG: alpha-amylase family glycosyl hydrolase, partial [Candidatus Phytoplasma australiense]|nr:alpha-amylase family glycosyl hydrolase [Candidatus Phytoplasma australiense]